MIHSGRERERVEAGKYECAAQLEAFFYGPMRTQMSALLSQHERRWAVYDAHSERVDLPTILTTAQSLATEVMRWEGRMRWERCRADVGGDAPPGGHVEDPGCHGVGWHLEQIESLMTRALDQEARVLTRQRNEVRANALMEIETTNAIVDRWLAGDGPEACGMSPRQ